MRHWLIIPAALAISACSLYYGGTHDTPHSGFPDAGIYESDDGGYLPDAQIGLPDGGHCGGGTDGGSYDPDGGAYGTDAGGYGADGGGYGADGGGYTGPDAGIALPDAH